MPCEKTTCECKELKVKLLCKHYTPSPNSKYNNCDYYYQYKLPCPFQEGRKSPCESCKYYDYTGHRGRVNLTGIKWSDRKQFNEYRRERRKCLKPPPNKS